MSICLGQAQILFGLGNPTLFSGGYETIISFCKIQACWTMMHSDIEVPVI